MNKFAIPNGSVIKQLRLEHPTFCKQESFAHALGTTSRTVRRIENKNGVTDLIRLKKMAQLLGVDLEKIAFSATAPEAEATNADEPELDHFERMTHAYLEPVTVDWLIGEVTGTFVSAVIPHVMVTHQPGALGDIEEFLGLLDGMIRRRLQFRVNAPKPEVHDTAPFPDISRARRLAELAKRLKGDDVRILGATEMWRVPEGQTSEVKVGNYEFQLVIAFAPPRGDYEDGNLKVAYDQGCDFKLPRKPSWMKF